MRRELPCRRATRLLARALGERLVASDLLVLSGDLGLGKTFLVRGLLRSLGLSEDVAVTSPTFVLVREYDASLGLRLPVLHADLYRLLDGGHVDEELAGLGLRARRLDGCALAVEWGAAQLEALGGDALVVSLLRDLPSGRRYAEVAATGPRSSKWREAALADFDVAMGRLHRQVERP